MKCLNELSNTVPVFVAVAGLVFVCASGAQADDDGVHIVPVPVGNPGNEGELSGASVPGGYGPDRVCGAVDYLYTIGKYEVTNAQYAIFLDAVADDEDTYDLYNTSMGSGYGGITRTVVDGKYAYSAIGDRENMPVNYVSWGDAARFANWLHNGQPGLDTPVRQDENSTEDGSYFLNGAMSTAELLAVEREPDHTWVIPTEDEWYKAAYHKNDGMTGNYWDYPTQSDDPPTCEPPPGTDPVNGSANCGSAVGDLTDVGSYTFKPSDSAYGTFDQGGNVWDWNEAIVGDSWRGIRGGTFYTDVDHLHAAYRADADPTYEDMGVGFRMAIPEPGMLSLLALGGLLVTRRRR